MFDFIDHNPYCPSCGNQLTLFLQSENAIFKTENVKSFVKLFDLYKHSECVPYDSGVNYFSKLNRRFLKIETPKLLIGNCFFFYVCNPKGIDVNSRINVYDACYYRRSSKFTINDDKTISMSNNLIIGAEICCLPIIEDDGEKVYSLDINYDLNITKFYYYDSCKEDSLSKNPLIQFQKTSIFPIN